MQDVIVLKCGGSIINVLSTEFFANILTLQQAGYKPVIVHGGGPAIKEMLDTLKIETEFIDGLRKTTEPVMDVAEMVLNGSVNNELLRKFNQAGIQAIGLSGSDAKTLTAVSKNIERYGLVGEITDVNVPLLHHLIAASIVPVIAPIALGENGTRYNVNADTVAGAVAEALSAEQLIFVTDVPGILKEGKLLEEISEQEIKHLIETGTIYGGMIPKVKAALKSLNEQLREVMIVDGKHSVIKADMKLKGTVITKSMEVVK
ncbi:MAG TPA: acetylglutamate kinase [Virgibacillus sp.]|nr:acetylglutamate kinase [Virgibacillus sp.]HLR65622.1 acetylglutamate kinase [Virgibacillus sp.]